MNKLYANVKDYYDNLNSRVLELEHVLDASPEGNLQIYKRRGKSFFCVRQTENGQRITKYISVDNESLINKYAKKSFAKALLPKLKSNLSAADKFLKTHSQSEENELAELLDPAILDNCTDIYASKVMIAESWYQDKGHEAPLTGGAPSIETISGELVRSKSEAMIANALHAHNLIYQYERPLYLKSKHYAQFPDFTILIPETYEEIYWEHFGLMDDPDYVSRTVEKLSDYAKNDILQGKNLICTFENREKPLSPADVERIICAFFE